MLKKIITTVLFLCLISSMCIMIANAANNAISGLKNTASSVVGLLGSILGQANAKKMDQSTKNKSFTSAVKK